jgi:hypothetical protein
MPVIPDRPKRKPTPIKIQLEVAKRQLAELLGHDLDKLPELQLDHDPALGLRPVDETGLDYSPGQHDPRFLVWRTKGDHARKTTGRKGESKLSISGNGDVSRIAKAERIEKKRAVPPPPRGMKHCWRCNGAGTRGLHYCRQCEGKGYMPKPESRPIQSRNDLKRKP